MKYLVLKQVRSMPPPVLQVRGPVLRRPLDPSPPPSPPETSGISQRAHIPVEAVAPPPAPPGCGAPGPNVAVCQRPAGGGALEEGPTLRSWR